jgi:Tol biopolymer transport system component
LVVVRLGADQKGDIFSLSIPAAGAPLAEFKPIVTGPGDQSEAAVSPDGRWIAWASNESGRPEVYVAAFRPGEAVRDAIRVSKAGGAIPVWSADGRRLRYVDPGRRVMSLPVSTTPALSAGTPELVFDAGKLNVFVSDMLPDGRQLVTIRGEEESDEIRRLAVVLNFSREIVEKTKAARRP